MSADAAQIIQELLQKTEGSVREAERDAIIHSAQEQAYRQVANTLQAVVTAFTSDPAITDEMKALALPYFQRINQFVERGVIGSARESLIQRGRQTALEEIYSALHQAGSSALAEMLAEKVRGAQEGMDAVLVAALRDAAPPVALQPPTNEEVEVLEAQAVGE